MCTCIHIYIHSVYCQFIRIYSNTACTEHSSSMKIYVYTHIELHPYFLSVYKEMTENESQKVVQTCTYTDAIYVLMI